MERAIETGGEKVPVKGKSIKKLKGFKINLQAIPMPLEKKVNRNEFSFNKNQKIGADSISDVSF